MHHVFRELNSEADELASQGRVGEIRYEVKDKLVTRFGRPSFAFAKFDGSFRDSKSGLGYFIDLTWSCTDGIPNWNRYITAALNPCTAGIDLVLSADDDENSLLAELSAFDSVLADLGFAILP